jgi:phospholipase D1/2
MILGGSLLALAVLAASWRHPSFAAWSDAERVTDWAERLGRMPWTPLAVLAAYTPAALTLFPRPLITLFAVAAFGPWVGFACACAGIVLAALATYAIGARFDDSTVRRLAGERFVRLGQIMRRGGVLAVTGVRLVPVAPFVIVNIVAGALRIRLAHFAAGSALGILPGTAAATVLGAELVTAVRAPHTGHLLAAAAVLLAIMLGTFAMRRWLWSRWTQR